MPTARDLIQRGLRTAGILGVGQTASAEDITEGFSLLNDMVAQWQVRRWMIYHLQDAWCTSTGANAYSVGPGMDIDLPARPNRIEQAFFRFATSGPTAHQLNLDSQSTTLDDNVSVLAPEFGGVNSIDYPLQLLESRQEYSSTTLKGWPTFPTQAFYDTGYPMAWLYVLGIPPAGYELHILVRAALQQFNNLSDNILFPPEYGEALHYNLAGRLQIAYGQQPNPGIVGLAAAAMSSIETANAQIPIMKMPAPIMSRAHFSVGIAAWGGPASAASTLGGTTADTAGASGTVTAYFIIGQTLLGQGVFGP